ncbi:MAG: hypothetical protein AAFY20_20540 [Cyanobacteria bacterium J06639_14]
MPFRFYANENLAAELVETLRQLGHDVLTAYPSHVRILSENIRGFP